MVCAGGGGDCVRRSGWEVRVLRKWNTRRTAAFAAARPGGGWFCVALGAWSRAWRLSQEFGYCPSAVRQARGPGSEAGRRRHRDRIPHMRYPAGGAKLRPPEGKCPGGNVRVRGIHRCAGFLGEERARGGGGRESGVGKRFRHDIQLLCCAGSTGRAGICLGKAASIMVRRTNRIVSIISIITAVFL
jgi:hypothetical protein